MRFITIRSPHHLGEDVYHFFQASYYANLSHRQDDYMFIFVDSEAKIFICHEQNWERWTTQIIRSHFFRQLQ